MHRSFGNPLRKYIPPSQRQHKRQVPIPDEIPVGFVIGKKGVVIKALQTQFNVQSSVDGVSRSLIVKGSPANVDSAIRHMEEMMGAFQLNARSARSVSKIILTAWKNASVHCFIFKRRSFCPAIEAEKDIEYPYDLVMTRDNVDSKGQSFGRYEEFHVDRKSWIMVLDEFTLAKISKQLDQLNDVPNVKIKLSFGKQAFKQSVIKPDTPIQWNQLTSMVMGEHIRGHWINFFDLKAPDIAALHARLVQESAHNQLKPAHMLTLYLQNNLENSSHRIKYCFNVDSRKWVLKSCHAHRTIHAIVNVAFSSEVQVRVRLISRDKGDVAEASKLAEWVVINTDQADLYNTSVSLRPGAPSGLIISEKSISIKTKVSMFGLNFNLYRMKDFTRLNVMLAVHRKSQNLGPAFCELIHKTAHLIKPRGKERVENGKTCCICFDELEGDGSEIQCPEAHRFCPLCFEHFVRCELEKDLSILRVNGTCIKCPEPKCQGHFTTKQIILCGEHIEKLWSSILKKLGEMDALDSIKRIEALHEHGKLGNRIEEAMNLCCPSCSAVFAEYDGCDAVKCRSCVANFCGLCLQQFPSSSDCHRHAGACGKEGTKGYGDYFSDVAFKKKCHRRLHQSRILGILESCSTAEKAWVKAKFGKMFAEEKIMI